MPYALVRVYAQRLDALQAQENLNLLTVMRVANADPKSHAAKQIEQRWKREAGRGEDSQKPVVAEHPTGLGER